MLVLLHISFSFDTMAKKCSFPHSVVATLAAYVCQHFSVCGILFLSGSLAPVSGCTKEAGIGMKLEVNTIMPGIETL